MTIRSGRAWLAVAPLVAGLDIACGGSKGPGEHIKREVDGSTHASGDSRASVDAGASADGTAGSTSRGTTGRDAEASDSPAAGMETSTDAETMRGAAPLGAACERSVECEPGLVCLTSTGTEFWGGGPANGLCSLECTLGGQTRCDSAAPGSFCELTNDQGTFTVLDDTFYCLPRCTFGDGVANKCLRRADMACYASGASEDGFCRPTCNGDFECGTRTCDFEFGVCVDGEELDGLLPMGAPCDPASALRQCAGFCGEQQGHFVCSGHCRYGEVGCGFRPLTPMPDAACVFSGRDETDGGDSAVCGELCNCNTDCTHPSALCDPMDPELASALGRDGFCLPPPMVLLPGGITCD